MLTIHPKSSTPDRAPAWIDLLNASDTEIAEAARLSGLRVPSREALSEIETSSRIFFEGGALYLSLPLITPVDDHLTNLEPVGFVVTKSALMTVRFAAASAFDAVAKGLEGERELKADDILTRLFEAMVDRAADRLERCGAELDQVSRAAFHTDTVRRDLSKASGVMRGALRKIGTIGDQLSHIRETLLGLDRISSFIIETPHCDFTEDVVHRLKAVHADIASLNGYIEHLTNKVQFLLDATLGFISIEQNDVVKVLTVVSVVGVPPVLIAGIYGMNFKLMPEYNWTFGYPYSLGLMAVSALIPLAWFKWRRWL